MVLEAQMAVTAVHRSTIEFQRQRRLLITPCQALPPPLIFSKATNRTLLIHPKRISVHDPQLHKIPLQALQVLYFLVRIVAQLSHPSGGEMKAAERYVTPAVRVMFETDRSVANTFQDFIINFTAYIDQLL